MFDFSGYLNCISTSWANVNKAQEVKGDKVGEHSMSRYKFFDPERIFT
jgi:hypothetical protein